MEHRTLGIIIGLLVVFAIVIVSFWDKIHYAIIKRRSTHDATRDASTTSTGTPFPRLHADPNDHTLVHPEHEQQE